MGQTCNIIKSFPFLSCLHIVTINFVLYIHELILRYFFFLFGMCVKWTVSFCSPISTTLPTKHMLPHGL